MTLLHGIPVPAVDYSGALSVLYSLGGVSVICSAGSCGRSYACVDEFRRLPGDKLYTTKMKMLHVIMGDNDVCETVIRASFPETPSFVALLGSPVPSMIGMDLGREAKRIEEKLKIPTLWINCDGFHCYTEGVASALDALGRKFLKQQESVQKSVNLIGYSPFCHGSQKELEPVRKLLTDSGVRIMCDWSKEEEAYRLTESTRAALNLVLSESGTALAEYMKAEYGIPYEMICPAGNYGLHQLENILQKRFQVSVPCPETSLTGKKDDHTDVIVIGEALFAQAVSRMFRNDLGYERAAAVCCETFFSAGKLRERFPQVRFADFEELKKMLFHLPEQSVVAGDVFFRRFASEQVKFVEIPNHGLCGNLFASLPWVGEFGILNIKKQLKEK